MGSTSGAQVSKVQREGNRRHHGHHKGNYFPSREGKKDQNHYGDRYKPYDRDNKRIWRPKHIINERLSNDSYGHKDKTKASDDDKQGSSNHENKSRRIASKVITPNMSARNEEYVTVRPKSVARVLIFPQPPKGVDETEKNIDSADKDQCDDQMIGDYSMAENEQKIGALDMDDHVMDQQLDDQEKEVGAFVDEDEDLLEEELKDMEEREKLRAEKHKNKDVPWYDNKTVKHSGSRGNAKLSINAVSSRKAEFLRRGSPSFRRPSATKDSKSTKNHRSSKTPKVREISARSGLDGSKKPIKEHQ